VAGPLHETWGDELAFFGYVARGRGRLNDRGVFSREREEEYIVSIRRSSGIENAGTRNKQSATNRKKRKKLVLRRSYIIYLKGSLLRSGAEKSKRIFLQEWESFVSCVRKKKPGICTSN